MTVTLNWLTVQPTINLTIVLLLFFFSFHYVIHTPKRYRNNKRNSGIYGLYCTVKP